jgi:hypothetical protein
MLIRSEMSEDLCTEEFSQLHVLIHVNETTTKYGFTKSQTLQYELSCESLFENL